LSKGATENDAVTVLEREDTRIRPTLSRSPSSSRMIVERTHYHAKPGRAADVLATRRRASEVRVALGLPRGQILVKADPAGDGPDVTWECGFPDAGAHARDLEARDRSPEFAAVRSRMTALIVRFERLVLVADDAPGEAALDPARSIVPAEVRIPPRTSSPSP
jgi:hypothetical protein